MIDPFRNPCTPFTFDKRYEGVIKKAYGVGCNQIFNFPSVAPSELEEKTEKYTEK